MVGVFNFFFFKQKTAYEMRISDWSSDVCSSDLSRRVGTLPSHASGADNDGTAVVGAGRVQRVINERATRAVARRVVAERRRFRDSGVGGDPKRENGRASSRERVCQSV